MHNVGMLRSIVLSVLVLLASHAFADEGGKHGKGTHMKVSGVVSQAKSGLVTVKTPWGRMTISSAGGLQNIEVGEEVEMWVNENNKVIDVHRKGDPTHVHHYVSGNLAYTSVDKKEIKLMTPDGEKTFAVEHARSKLSTMEEGTAVTVELNEAGNVIDVHRLDVEIHIAERPQTKPGYHMTVNGVVDKIQSGVIFLTGPAARYTLSAKTDPSDVKVGDEVTLWINENNTVIDHHRKGHEKAHRLISGKLIYVGKTKKEIKLWTPEGEQVFPLERMEIKTKPIKEGSQVTVELNEEGTVISLRKSKS